MARTGPSEEQNPLLGSSSDYEDGDTANSLNQNRYWIPSRLYTIALLFGAMSLSQFGISFLNPAFSQIQEETVCREYYNNVTDSANDPRCKRPNVQSDLSMLQGVEMTCGLIPPVLLSATFGIAGDLYGRQPILRLACFGLMLLGPLNLLIYAFPELMDIRIIWAAAFVAASIGGGIPVFSAMAHTITTDVTTPKEHTNVFYYLNAALVFTPLVGNPLAYAAMKAGPWISAFIGCACSAASFATAFLVPETRIVQAARIHIDDQLDGRNTDETQSPLAARSTTSQRWAEAAPSRKSGIFSSLRKVIWDNKKIGLVLMSTLFTRIGT